MTRETNGYSERLLGLSRTILKRLHMEGCTPHDTPINKRDKFSKDQYPRNEIEKEQMDKYPCMAAIGSLTYALTCIRPDISFAVGMLCIDTRKSTSWYIFLLSGRTFSWRSAKQMPVTPSTFDVEYIACFEAAGHAMSLRNFISRLRIMDQISKPMRIYCDDVARHFT